jgi:FkbM family methyltransferase
LVARSGFVTRSFYESGWYGINIEPNSEFHQKLQERRPKDTNLFLAIGDRAGTLTMNFLGNPGLSTLDDTVAKKHQQEGWSLDRLPVQVSTLAETWRRHVPVCQPVHFLKIDVEGFEEAVLRGNDWTTNRPWVVLVEATLPMSQIETHDAWEPILLEASYWFAYADGLNRFYVAHEHADLLSAFKYPPNVFDDFVLTGQQQAEANAQRSEAKAQQAEAKAQQAEAKAQQAEAKAQQAEAKAQQAEAKAQQTEAKAQQTEAKAQQTEAASHQALIQLQEVYASTSWRITEPLRSIRRLSSQLSPRHHRSRVKLSLQHAALYVNRRPKLRRVVLMLLNRVPGVKRHLTAIVIGAPMTTPPREDTPTELAHLTPRARQIHADLKSALARRQRESR